MLVIQKVFMCTCIIYTVGAGAIATANDYYVSTNGSDSATGTQSAPFRTITYAYSRVVAGDRILVRPGTYSDYQSNYGLSLNKKGTATAPITLKSIQRGGAILDASGESDRNYTVYIGGNYNVLDGFKITGANYDGIVLSSGTGGGNNNTIINNDVCNNGRVYSSSHIGNQGIYSDEHTSSNYYGQNYIHDNGGAYGGYDNGLYISGNNDMLVNNIVVRHPGSGLQIAVYSTATGTQVYNNLFGYNGNNGIVIGQNLSNSKIYNNIIVWNSTNGIDSYAATGSGVSIANNFIYGNTASALNLPNGSSFSYKQSAIIQQDPLFVSSTDYHLTSSSPAIGAGKALTLVSQDFDGNPRPSGMKPGWDIGPYQYLAGGGTSGLASGTSTSTLSVPNGSSGTGAASPAHSGNAPNASGSSKTYNSISTAQGGTGAGGLSQNVISATTGSQAPGGSDTDIQYNCSGSLCGSPYFTWNNSAYQLNLSVGGAFMYGTDGFPNDAWYFRGRNAVGLPVPYFHSTSSAANGSIAFDLIPFGKPSENTLPGTGVAWIDVCNTDQFLGTANSYQCTRVGSGVGYGVIGSISSAMDVGAGENSVPLLINPGADANVGIYLLAGSQLPTAPLDVGGPIRSRANPTSARETPATSNVSLAAIGGFSSGPLVSGKIFSFEVDLYFSSCDAAGGVKVDMGASTNISALAGAVEIYSASGVQSAYVGTATAVTGQTVACTHVHMSGVAVTNGTGSLVPRFAQNASDAVPTTVYTGSMHVIQLN